MKRLVVPLVLVLLFASVVEATVINWGHIPTCWVINCRKKYGASCLACIQLNCGSDDAMHPVATTWCNERVPMPWRLGDPVPTFHLPPSYRSPDSQETGDGL